MKRMLLLALLCLCTLASGAELSLYGDASDHENKGNDNKVLLSAYLDGFVDSTAAMTIDQAAKTALFMPATAQLLRPGYTKSAIWLRLKLTNASDQAIIRWISIAPSRLREVSLYVPENASWQRMDGGSATPFSRHPIAYTDPVFPVQLAARQSITLYVRVASWTSINIMPTLWKQTPFHHMALRQSILDGILVGGLILTAIYGLLMYVTLREQAFLLHAITTVLYCLYEISFRGYGLAYLWPDATIWATRSISLLNALCIAGLLLFTRVLLLTRIRLPHWDRILLVILELLCVQVIGVAFADYRTFAQFGSALGSITLLSILVTACLAIRYQFPAIRFYITAFSIVLLGNLLRIGSVFGFIPSSPFSEYMTPLFTLLGNILLLAASVDRIMQARKEKEQAQLALIAAHTAYETQLQKDVDTRTADLHAALVETREATQTKSRLLAYISHDLRTPLTTIIQYVHRLNRNASKEALKYQATIEHSAAQQLELIDDLVEYARGDLEQLQLVCVPTYLHAWLDDISRQAELLAGEYGNAFTTEFDSQLPPIIAIDPKRLRQVLSNLLVNAAKFTNGGNIALRVDAERLSEERFGLSFAVTDSGPGIAQTELERIFQPFERIISERQGSGLGLSIARQIVRGMGSELKVASQPGQGSRFEFRIVVATASESDVVLAFQVATLPDPFGNGKTILVADDNPASRDYVEEILLAADFNVVLANNGLEAIQNMTTHKIDALVLDQFMPGMGGWAVLQQLREQHCEIPIVLYSTMPPQRPAGYAMHLDFDAVLLKPASANHILSVIHKLFHPAHSHPATSQPAYAAPHLPPRFLVALRAFIAIGSLSEIEVWAAQLACDHPEFTDFAERLGDAARKVDLAELSRLMHD